ncbi:hypothetical protein CEN47_26135, partial [Fischerella thermalis CCMEE 5319]
IWSNQIDAVIVPASACGSSALLNLSQSQSLIVTVQENHTLLRVPPQPLGIKSVEVNSYLEAVGVLVAHKAGINPYALNPEISQLRCLNN